MTQQERDDLLILEDWNRNHRIVDGVEGENAIAQYLLVACIGYRD